MSDSDGGLAATDEHQRETPPAPEDDGHEHEAGAAQKDKSEDPASSGDDPEDVPKGVRKRIQRAVRDRDVEVGRRAQAEAERDQLRERLKKYEPDDDSKRTEPEQQRRREPAPDPVAQARQAKLKDFSEDGEDKYDDFTDVVNDNPRLRVTTAMADAMFEAENGVDIAYHLGKNPKEARRIAGLSEVAQAKAIGNLEIELAAAAKKPAVKVSKAPSPIEPLNGGKSHPKGLRAESSMDDFIKATR